MKNLKMFCISLEPNHYEFIKNLGYIPVGLGEKDFNESWLSDKSFKKYSHVTIFFLLIFYGLSLEILQSFTLTRSPELFDFFSDLLGILVYFYLIPKLKLISK